MDLSQEAESDDFRFPPHPPIHWSFWPRFGLARRLSPDNRTLTFHTTCQRGLFDDQSKAAVDFATGRLTLFDTKSSVRVGIVTAMLGGVVAIIKALQPVAGDSALWRQASFDFAVVLASVQALFTLGVIFCNYRINDIRLYKVRDVYGAKKELKNYEKLTLQSESVKTYLAYLSDFIIIRDYYWQLQRFAFLAALFLAVLAVTVALLLL